MTHILVKIISIDNSAERQSSTSKIVNEKHSTTVHGDKSSDECEKQEESCKKG